MEEAAPVARMSLTRATGILAEMAEGEKKRPISSYAMALPRAARGQAPRRSTYRRSKTAGHRTFVMPDATKNAGPNVRAQKSMAQLDHAPVGHANTFYVKAMLAWAAGRGVGAVLTAPLAALNETRIRNVVLAILIGGFIGFVRTADTRREFVYIVAIGRAARGALNGPILLVAAGLIAELGAALLAQHPLPIAELFSWKWWIGSMVVTATLSGGGLLAEENPGEVLPYARKAGKEFSMGWRSR
jgi:hypothetical protein